MSVAPVAHRLLAPALALLLGLAHALSFAPLNLWPVQIAALAGLFVLAARVADARQAAVLGLAFGLGWFGLGVHWVYISMHVYGQMWAWLAALATLALAAFLALFAALALWLAWRWPAGLAVRLLLLAPAAWAFGEWLRSWVLTGFPWLASGYAHADGPLAGYAPIFGVHGLTLFAAWLAGAAALLLRGPPSGWARGAPVAAVLLLAGGGQALKTVVWSAPVGEPVRVRLAQGNIPQDIKFTPDGLQRTVDTHMALLRQPGPVDLAVLPESVFPLPVNLLPNEVTRLLRDHVVERNVALVFGAFIEEPVQRYFNSALALVPDGRGGTQPAQRYSKRHLVPFGEFIPWGFRWFVDLMQMPIGDQERGDAYQPPMQLAGQRVAVNICYEDLFGDEIIRAWDDPAAAPTLLLNISNLAWFDDSIALDQHLQISRMRALETARPVLRATNTGATAVIDARGQVLAALPYRQVAVLDHAVRGHAGDTPYVRWGNGPALALIALLFVAGVIAGRRRAAAGTR